MHSSCVALVRLLRPGQQLKRVLFGRRASEVPLHRCSALARGRDCTLPRHGARVFRVSSLRHSTFRAWVTKFTHAAESSQNVPTRGGNEAQKRKETRRRARGPLFLNGLNLMAHVSRWVIGSCWVIGSLNLTWVDWVNWVIA